MASLNDNGNASWERPLTGVLWGLIGIAACGVVFALKGALLPFFLAFVIAYVFAPWVDRLERRAKLPRPAGTALVFVVLSGIVTLLIVGLLPVIEGQLSRLAATLPGALARLKEVGLPFLAGVLPEMPQTAQAWLDTAADSIRQFGPKLMHATSGVLVKAAAGTVEAFVWVASAAIIPILVFYLMVDFHQVTPWLLDRIPDTAREAMGDRLTRIDRMLGEYLRGQLTVGVVLSALYASGLALAGVEAAAVIGIIAGLGNMVPYLGFVVGIALSLAITFLTYFDLLHLLYVVIVFAVVQGLEGFVISPKIVGDRVGLHPVAIIFALFVGGEAFGFLGILLGVPAAIAVKVLIESPPAPAKG